MGMTRTNREVKSSFFMNDICQGCLSLFADGCLPRVFLCCFSPCLCYTRDVADLSELTVARDAQSPFVCARDTSGLVPVCFQVVSC